MEKWSLSEPELKKLWLAKASMKHTFIDELDVDHTLPNNQTK